VNSTPAPAPRRRRWLRAIALLALATLVLLCGGAAWLLCTGAGLRFALARAQDATHGALEAQQAQGRLIGPLDIGSLRYSDGEGTDVAIAHLHLDWHLATLLFKRLHVTQLRVDRIDVMLPTSQAPSSSGSLSLKPPLALVLDDVHVGPVTVMRNHQPLFASDQLDLAGRWTRAGIAVDRLALRAPDGYVHLDGQLGIGRRYRGKGHAQAAWKVGGIDYAGDITAQGDGRKAQLQLSLTEPMLAQLQLSIDQRKDNSWSGKLDVPAFNPQALLGDSSITRLGANLQGSGDDHAGSISGSLALNDYRLLLQPLQAQLDHDFNTLTLQRLQVASPQIKGTIDATGSVQLDAHPISADLAIDWNGLELPASLVGQTLDSQGHLIAKGSAERYHAEGDIAIGPPGKPAKLALNLDGTPRQIQLRTLDLLQPQGRLAASGELTLQPLWGWHFQATASKFDPGQLFAAWPGLLDADFATEGLLSKDKPDVTLDLRKLEGTLRQRRLHGSGHLHLSPNEVVDGALELASGNSSVKVVARAGERNDADVTLAIASLGDWLPQAGGQLDGRFQVRGAFPKLSVDGNLQGRALAWQGQNAGRLQLQANIPDITTPGGKLALDASSVELGGLAFDQIRVNGQGTAAQHQLTLQAQGRPLSASLALSGSLKDANWNGTLSALTLDLQGLPRWRLQQATRLGWNQGAASLGSLCLTAGDPSLCVSGTQDKTGNIDASYQLHAVPLTLVMDALGNADIPVSAEGTLQGQGKLHRNAAGTLTGNATITSQQGRIIYREHPNQPALTYDNLAVNATLAPGHQQVTVHAGIDGSGQVDGQATVSGAQQALAGQLRLHLDNLSFIELFTDEVANVKGRLDGNFRLDGSLQEPAITGQASVIDFAAEVPDAGLKLTQGRVTISAANTRELRIDGSVQSGKGSVTLAGVAGLDAQTPTTLTLKGSQFTAVDIPAAKVIVSPDVSVRRDAQGINATGSVKLDSADVNLDKLPGSGVNKASPDIVIVDQPQQPASGNAMPINASIRVDLGQHTHLAGMGLDGHLSGVLTVNERPGRQTTGQGQISVSGTYKAYGQNLKIQQGQLLFASTPIDNPGLNIKAVRSLTPNATIDQGQQVGLQISGTAQRPVLTVFSNPPMEQSDALSYLVTGKPLSQVKGGEGNTVNAAAQALGSATGNYLAKNVGSKLGISDIGVSSSDALNGNSAFTVGKYLSPRLYLSYGVGLFEPGQVITLRYRLSKRWNFEAQNATDFNRASLNYRIEK